MRRSLGTLLIITGLAVLAAPSIPVVGDVLDDHLSVPAWQLTAAGAITIVVGIVLRRRRGRRSLDDQPIRAVFTKRQFQIVGLADGGWQASGTWNQTIITARWHSGVHASRFGRPWVLVITVPGRPAEPLPLVPSQAALVNRSANPDQFDVVLPESGIRGGHGVIATRIDQVLASRVS